MNMLREFLDSSTIHGLVYISSAKVTSSYFIGIVTRGRICIKIYPVLKENPENSAQGLRLYFTLIPTLVTIQIISIVFKCSNGQSTNDTSPRLKLANVCGV